MNVEGERGGDPMTDSERNGWRCFHCDFETTDEQEAAAHFGEDMGEQAICLLWSQISKEDKLREYQDTLRELEGERRNNMILRAQNETLEYQRDMFSEELIRYFGPDCTSLWVAGDRYNNALFALKLAEEKEALSHDQTSGLRPDSEGAGCMYMRQFIGETVT